jgi:mannose-6-phosphate isomerase-like protein (cupin superfamily)
MPSVPTAPFVTNIEQDTLANTDYRRVVFTGKGMQLVYMTLQVGEEIGIETHPEHDQFFRVEQGTMKAVVNGVEYTLTQDMVIVVPAGAEHNIINVGDVPVKLYTIYAPAEHPAGTVQHTKVA